MGVDPVKQLKAIAAEEVKKLKAYRECEDAGGHFPAGPIEKVELNITTLYLQRCSECGIKCSVSGNEVSP